MNFVELGLCERTVLSLQHLGFESPTEIQAKAIPLILEGRSILASAETGSGKTAAYALPVIQEQSNNKNSKPRVLVLVPTRELVVQVDEQFRLFSRKSRLRTVCIYGGAGMERQTKQLERGVDIIVATPGRLFDHINRRNVDLSAIEVLVLDEADRMLDMGFIPQVRQIVRFLPKTRQTLMFSATISEGVDRAAKQFLNRPVNISVNTNRVEPENIEQKIYQVDELEKVELLIKLINEQPATNSVLVFTRTRFKTSKIRKKLLAANILAEEIHGSISQNKREQTLARFRKGKFSVLVATDLAARGLDIPTISHVINFDLPEKAEDYVHRIGRTGRAGRSGVAVSFVCDKQRHLVRGIEKVTKKQLVPDDHCQEFNPHPPRKRRFRRSRKRAKAAY